MQRHPIERRERNHFSRNAWRYVAVGSAAIALLRVGPGVAAEVSDSYREARDALTASGQTSQYTDSDTTVSEEVTDAIEVKRYPLPSAEESCAIAEITPSGSERMARLSLGERTADLVFRGFPDLIVKAVDRQTTDSVFVNSLDTAPLQAGEDQFAAAERFGVSAEALNCLNPEWVDGSDIILPYQTFDATKGIPFVAQTGEDIRTAEWNRCPFGVAEAITPQPVSEAFTAGEVAYATCREGGDTYRTPKWSELGSKEQQLLEFHLGKEGAEKAYNKSIENLQAVAPTWEKYDAFVGNIRDVSEEVSQLDGYNDVFPSLEKRQLIENPQIVMHFTAGPEFIPSFSGQRFVQSLIGNYKTRGYLGSSNYYIGGDGVLYILTKPGHTAYHAKNKHNALATGLEIAATSQEAVTTLQYESAMYTTIWQFMSHNPGVDIRDVSLTDWQAYIFGHGEISRILDDPQGHGDFARSIVNAQANQIYTFAQTR